MVGTRPFTATMATSEVSGLRRMHAMLEHDGVADRDQFHDLMKAIFGNDRFNPRDLANDMGYSQSAVYRWVDGTSAPHPSFWPNIVDWVVTKLDTRIDELEAQAEAL